MTLSWLGQACIVIKSKAEKTLVIDPYSSDIGISMPKLEAEVVLVTHDHHDHNNVAGVSGKPFVVKESGEYEVGGFFIETIESFHDAADGKERGKNLIFVVTVDGYRLAHFGDFGQNELTQEQLQQLSQIDIACIPVGGHFTVDGKTAAKVVHQLEPKVCVPMHHKIPGLTVKELAGPEGFLEALGTQPDSVKEHWTVKAADFPNEGTSIVTLKPMNSK